MPARPASQRPWLPPGPGRDWPAASRQRRALWQAVSAAEFAVLSAQQSGAHAGELDALCHRLRLAAQDAERSLSAARLAPASGRRPDQPSSAIGDLLTAAALIQDAAASAAVSQSQPATRSLADDAHRQVEAIAMRIASAARATAGIPSAGS
jgi:hypothetical protein